MSKGCRQLLSVLLALLFVLSLLASSVNVAQANPTTPEQDYALASSVSDNATSQSDNITRTVLILGYDKAGNMIEDGSNVITLTPEQLAEADRLIEQYRKKYAQDPNRIRFQSGYIMALTAGTVDASILKNGKTSGNDYYLIQFYTYMSSVDKETRDTINQIGCTLNPVGNHAFYAKIPPDALDTVISLVNTGKVRYLGRIPDEAKISPELLDKAQLNPNNSIKINLRIFDDASDSDIDTLSKLMRIDWHWTDSIAGKAPADNIKDIIALNFVLWVEEQCIMSFENNDGTSATVIPQEKRDYLVVLNTESAENKNSVLAVNDVEYIQDAIYIGTHNEKYPAIAISANEQAADQIRNLDFVIAVSPLTIISPAPVPPSDGEINETTSTRLLIIAGIFAILVLAIAMIIYLIRRRNFRLDNT